MEENRKRSEALKKAQKKYREKVRMEEREEKRKAMHQLLDELINEGFSVVVAGKKPHCGNMYLIYGNKNCIVGMANKIIHRFNQGKL